MTFPSPFASARRVCKNLGGQVFRSLFCRFFPGKPVITSAPDIRFLLSRPGRFFALGCGLGLAPKAPGTFGTLGGYPLALALLLAPLPFAPWSAWAILALAFVIGCAWCDEAGVALGVPDHGSIVWDEIVAFAGVLLCAPMTGGHWLLAFLLFRLFDILKPWPIRVADARLKNGFGVMFDDLLAAVYAVAAQHALIRLGLEKLF